MGNTERDRIMKNAFTIYLKYGFSGISLNSLISKLGIKKSSLYYYFKNKDDLINNIVEKYLYSFGWLKIDEIFEAASTTKERVRKMMMEFLDFEKNLKETVQEDIEVRDLFKMMIDDSNRAGEEKPYIEQYNKRVSLLVESIEEDKVRNIIPKDIDSKEFAYHIVTCLDGLNYIYMTNNKVDFIKQSNIQLKFLWRGID